MRKTSPIPIVLIALVALIVFGYANNAAFHSGDHPDVEEANQAIAEKMAAEKSAASGHSGAQKSQTPAPARPVPAGSAPVVSELTVGDPATAKTRMTLGYYATDQIAENPDAINSLVTVLEGYVKSQPSASLRVVCLDIPSADRQNQGAGNVAEGVSKNGQVVAPFPGDAPPSAAALTADLAH